MTKMLRLKIVTDGSMTGTKLVDMDTGDVVEIDGHVSMDVYYSPAGPHKNHVSLTFQNIPVEVTDAVTTPIHLIGVATGGKEGLPKDRKAMMPHTEMPRTQATSRGGRTPIGR